jgi:hypothetical protein
MQKISTIIYLDILELIEFAFRQKERDDPKKVLMNGR